MSDINHVILVGRLTRDSELKYSSGGMAICRFAVAINRRKKNGEEWVDEPNFFDIVLFGKSGESVSQYLVKGKQVAVEGELHQNRWEQDGQSRSKIEIYATNVQLLGSGGSGGGPGSYGNSGGGSADRGAGQSRGQQPYREDDSYGDGQIRSGGQDRQNGQSRPGSSVPKGDEDFNEDIPF